MAAEASGLVRGFKEGSYIIVSVHMS